MALAQKVIYFEDPLIFTPPPEEKSVAKRSRSLWLPIFLLVSLTTACSLLFILYLSLVAEGVEARYKLAQLEQVESALREEQLSLRIEVQALSSLSRIESIARTTLNMGNPEERLVMSPVPAAHFYKVAWKGHGGGETTTLEVIP